MSPSATPTRPPPTAARLSGLVTPDLLQTLEGQFAPPAVQQQRAQQHLVSKSSGSIAAIRSFGSTPQASITFVVDITVQATASGQDDLGGQLVRDHRGDRAGRLGCP